MAAQDEERRKDAIGQAISAGAMGDKIIEVAEKIEKYIRGGDKVDDLTLVAFMSWLDEKDWKPGDIHSHSRRAFVHEFLTELHNG